MKWTSILSMAGVVAASLATAFSAQLQTFWAHNPVLAAVIVGVWGVIAHFLPAPTSTTKN